jgi:hypothetical protein
MPGFPPPDFHLQLCHIIASVFWHLIRLLLILIIYVTLRPVLQHVYRSWISNPVHAARLDNYDLLPFQRLRSRREKQRLLWNDHRTTSLSSLIASWDGPILGRDQFLSGPIGGKHAPPWSDGGSFDDQRSDADGGAGGVL